ncbi:MAG: hypothetical protein JXR58_10615 [Bacteroidales bacterium]|nr:hypothetical protein [Bacteroidales bacterium]
MLSSITTGSIQDFAYKFDPAKVHAVRNVFGNPGTITNNVQQIAYNSFNSISSISESNYQMDFVYGLDQQRRKSVLTNTSTSTQTTTYYRQL